MGNTRYYKALENRIGKLKIRYHYDEGIDLPSQDEQDDLRAFTLLCHAELEAYFENIARTVVEKAKKKWDKDHIANYNLASLFLREENVKKAPDIPTKVGYVYSKYLKNLDYNNGITKKDLFNMFEPIGYEKNDFNEAFLIDVENLGRQRGEYAHLSFKTVQIKSQKDIYDLIDRIMLGLKDFEKMIKSREKRFSWKL